MYSLKYSGTDKPKKRATPVMKRFLIEFMFVNCKNDSPTEALNKKEFNCQIKREDRIRLIPKVSIWRSWNLPTRPNRTQYTAAKMVKGIDAKKAPNFPAAIKKFS